MSLLGSVDVAAPTRNHLAATRCPGATTPGVDPPVRRRTLPSSCPPAQTAVDLLPMPVVKRSIPTWSGTDNCAETQSTCQLARVAPPCAKGIPLPFRTRDG